jgi:hypothetical protein
MSAVRGVNQPAKVQSEYTKGLAEGKTFSSKITIEQNDGQHRGGPEPAPNNGQTTHSNPAAITSGR